MSSRRDKKGFTKLAPTEELALNEMVAINSGSELELLDLSSTAHRRGGEDDRTGCCCYGWWCVTGCLLLLTIVVVVLSLGIVYLVYSLHQLQTQVSAMEHRVNTMNSSVISVQSKVAGDHKMYDRKYYIMVASTARSIDMLNKTLTTIQRTMAEEDIQKEFVITALNGSLSFLSGFSRQVSAVYHAMAQSASRMKSMSTQLNELTRAQGDLKGEMDKLTSTASADHDLTQTLQSQTTKQLNQFTEGFHNLQQTVVNMSKQLDQLEWVPLSLQDLTTALLNTTQMMKALSQYNYTTQSPPTDSMTANPSAETTSSTNPIAPTSSNAEPSSADTIAPTSSNPPFSTNFPASSDNTEPTSASPNVATEPDDVSTTPDSISTTGSAPSTSSSTDMSTDSVSTPNQAADNSTLATEDNPHTGTNSTGTVNTPTSDTPTNTTDNTSDIPVSTTTDTPTNAATYTPTYETDTPTTAATDTPPTNETDTPTTAATDTPPTNETDTPTNAATDTPPTNETDTPTNAATASTMPVTPSTSLASTSFTITPRERLPPSTVGRISATPLPVTPTGNGAIRSPVELLEAVLEQFSQLDTDNSNSLEWSEFSNALNDRGIFDDLDRNENGSLTREELQSAIDVLKKSDAEHNSAE